MFDAGGVPGDDGVAVAGRHAAVQPQVGDGGQFGLQQVVLHNVQHALQLTEDENAMLRHHCLCPAFRSSAAAKTAIQ